jgi:hypothetical protein
MGTLRSPSRTGLSRGYRRLFAARLKSELPLTVAVAVAVAVTVAVAVAVAAEAVFSHRASYSSHSASFSCTDIYLLSRAKV